MTSFEASSQTDGLARLLVAVEGYPHGDLHGEVCHQFVHVRNTYYQRAGFVVDVLNVSAKTDYCFQGISVICEESYKKSAKQYDLLLCHQPNLKHHLTFCSKNLHKFKKVIFFFHGHEVLKMSKSYPEPYPYARKNPVSVLLRDMYDELKFSIWRNYFSKIKHQAKFVFVSDWMYREFKRWLKVDDTFLGEDALIIPNCIGEAFEIYHYDTVCEKDFDFVTIRGNLDTSKYAVDLVIESARMNPKAKFLIVGKGEIFDHFGKPYNITWINSSLSHDEIIEKLNRAKCALMPTRTDAQGLMMCEMASYGIPLISSDVEVCQEVLAPFSNVRLQPNSNFGKGITDLIKEIEPAAADSVSPYSKAKTIELEVQLMREQIWGFGSECRSL